MGEWVPAPAAAATEEEPKQEEAAVVEETPAPESPVAPPQPPKAPASQGTSLADLMAGLGKDENAPANQPAPERRSLADLVSGGDTVAKPVPAAAAAAAEKRVSSNVFASGDNQNCGNSITDRSTTRVRAPPGGHSSISFC
mmetsp:Transcript_26683/g.83538  ORF Transcript_26683/g.83538 Transcript_26683/m.83538 type:complete len:141 (-) Transcript_26683:1896-2318(-)